MSGAERSFRRDSATEIIVYLSLYIILPKPPLKHNVIYLHICMHARPTQVGQICSLLSLGEGQGGNFSEYVCPTRGKCPTFMIHLCQLWPEDIAPGQENLRLHVHLLMTFVFAASAAKCFHRGLGPGPTHAGTLPHISQKQLKLLKHQKHR